MLGSLRFLVTMQPKFVLRTETRQQATLLTIWTSILYLAAVSTVEHSIPSIVSRIDCTMRKLDSRGNVTTCLIMYLYYCMENSHIGISLSLS